MRKEVFNKFINSWVFKIIILISIIVTIFAVTNYGLNKSYAVALQSILSSSVYIVCGLFLPLFVTTINIYNIFNNNYFFKIRLDSKQNEIKELLKCSVYANSIMFLVVFLLLFVFLNLSCASNLEFMNSYQFYNIPNIIYIIFYIVRLYAIMIVVSLFNSFLLEKFSTKVVIGLNIVFYGIFFDYNYVPFTDGRTSILDTSPLIFEYLQLNSYSTFLTEILCSIFALLLPILLLKVILSFNLKRSDVNSFKYVVLNDTEYTIRTKKFILIFYFAYLIIYSLIKIFVMNYNDNGFNVVLGLNADINDNFLNVISFFLNALVFVMLGTMLFVKDLSKNKSNIFLRINKTKWTILKIISIIIQFAILLAVGYLVTFTIFSLFNKVPDNTLLLYFTNLTIFILLELFILILIYGNVILKLLIGLGLILLLCFNLTRVVSMTNYIWYLVVSLIIMIIFAIMIFRKRIYKLFESEVFR